MSAELSRRESAPKKWEPLATHPVDVSLPVLKGAIEYAVGQPITLGISQQDHFELGITNVVNGSGRFLVYGAEGTKDMWELPFWSMQLEKNDPKVPYVRNYLDKRSEYTNVDERYYSRMLLADSEIKPLKEFATNAIRRVLNVSPTEIAASDIDLSRVSYSQAKRLIDVIRNEYTNGNWREVVQLGLAMSHINSFISMARIESFEDKTDSIVTIADTHMQEELQREFRTDIDLLMIRALRRGAQELHANGRTHAASHAEAWISLMAENMTLDVFSPEVTIEDILTYPSFLNPRPDKGIPEMWSGAYMMGGTGSRNFKIKYPDGSVYAVDYPDHSEGARPILGNEEEGYKGHITDDHLKGLRYPDKHHEWVTDFKGAVERHVAWDLAEALLKKETFFKKNSKTYAEILRMANDFINSQDIHLDKEQRDLVKHQLAAVLMAAQAVACTRESVGRGFALFEYSYNGFSNKDSAEQETEISLTSFGGKWTDELEKAYTDFGNALFGYELARVADAYINHPELSTHIAKFREMRKLKDDAGVYYQQMMEAAGRLMGKGKALELVRTGFTKGAFYSNQQGISSGDATFLGDII